MRDFVLLNQNSPINLYILRSIWKNLPNIKYIRKQNFPIWATWQDFQIGVFTPKRILKSKVWSQHLPTPPLCSGHPWNSPGHRGRMGVLGWGLAWKYVRWSVFVSATQAWASCGEGTSAERTLSSYCSVVQSRGVIFNYWLMMRA